jgi:hypothetical protein
MPRVRLRRAALIAAAASIALGGPAAGTALASASSASWDASALLDTPFVAPHSLLVAPEVSTPTGVRRFDVDGLQALQLAERAPAVLAIHRREHPLRYAVLLWVGANPSPHWAIDFSYRGSLVAEVDVGRHGRVEHVWTGALASYIAGRGHFGGLFDSPWVVLTFSAAFLALFFNPRRLRRIGHLDAVLMLALFALPYWLFDHLHFDAAVLTVYPFLVLVLGRMLWLGLRRGPRADPGAPRWPLPFLATGVIALTAARIALDIAHTGVLDVGFASVIGAHAIAHGQELYTAASAHGDTYGPFLYLAYVPFELLWPWSGAWDSLPAAHAAAIFFDVGTTVGLLALGMRLRRGAEGRRLGLTMAWAWAAYPGTLLSLMTNTNDGLVALLFVLMLLALSSPAGRGLGVGLATAAKLFPAALLPLLAAGWGEQRARRAAVVCLAFALVVLATFLPFVPSGGLHALYERTIGFQLTRSDVFSVWGLHPGLHWMKALVELAAVGLSLGLPLLIRDRSTATFAALACAITIALQLGAEHWFFNYLVWVAPLWVVAVLARQAPAATQPAAVQAPRVRRGGVAAAA